MSNMLTSVPEFEGMTIFSLIKGEESIKNYFLSKLKAEHFGLYAPNIIFQKLTEYTKTAKSYPSLEILRSDPKLPEECRAYLNMGQFEAITNKDDATCAIDILESYRQIRLCASTAAGMLSKIKMEDPDIKSIQLDMEKTLMELRAPADDDSWVHNGVGNNSDKYVQDIMDDKAPALIKTGFSAFDNVAGGLEKTGEFIVSSVPGGGKSVMAIQLGVNMTKLGHSYCLISYEMNKTQCFNRYLSNICQVPYEAIHLRRCTFQQKQHLWERYRKHKEMLEKTNTRFTIFVPTENYTIPDYKALLKPYGYDAIAFDYINLIPGYDDKQMWERLLLHSKDGKMVAQQIETLVIILAQMDEDTKKLRYARALKENANNWWRWDYDEKVRDSHILSIDQAKARDSKQFPFSLIENYEYMSINDIPQQSTYGNQQSNKIDTDSSKKASLPTMQGLSDDDD